MMKTTVKVLCLMTTMAVVGGGFYFAAKDEAIAQSTNATFKHSVQDGTRAVVNTATNVAQQVKAVSVDVAHQVKTNSMEFAGQVKDASVTVAESVKDFATNAAAQTREVTTNVISTLQQQFN